MIQVDVDDELFRRWTVLGFAVTDMRTAVQNSYETEMAVIEDFEDVAAIMKRRYSELVDDTLRHLLRHA